MAKNLELEPQIVNLIANGTTVKGEINAAGDMRIDGTHIGSITSKGKVVIGTTGRVEGEIHCQSADFSGHVKANLTVTELLSLKATASLTGEITIGKLSIEPGAKFSGKCVMNNAAKPMNEIPKPDEKQQ
jgi:cytoskeletal protein CcmA (bactofilin family)